MKNAHLLHIGIVFQPKYHLTCKQEHLMMLACIQSGSQRLHSFLLCMVQTAQHSHSSLQVDHHTLKQELQCLITESKNEFKQNQNTWPGSRSINMCVQVEIDFWKTSSVIYWYWSIVEKHLYVLVCRAINSSCLFMPSSVSNLDLLLLAQCPRATFLKTPLQVFFRVKFIGSSTRVHPGHLSAALALSIAIRFTTRIFALSLADIINYERKMLSFDTIVYFTSCDKLVQRVNFLSQELK